MTRIRKECYVLFGKYVKRTRENSGLNQKQFADLTGLSQPMVSALENGSRGVDLETAIEICRVLKVDLSDFIKDFIS